MSTGEKDYRKKSIDENENISEMLDEVYLEKGQLSSSLTSLKVENT
jgi:hypothetical protein